MLLRKTFDKKTGIYRSKDAIENFHFRITLKTLNSFVKVPKFNAEELTETDDLDEVEYEDFCWQQKRLKSSEIEYFRNADNCKTDSQKRHHLEILEQNGNAGMHGRRIFSYVIDDKYVSKEDRMDQIGDRTFIWNVENLGDSEASTAAGNVLVDSAMPHVIRSRYRNLGQFETMYIMADLEEEVTLIIIKYRPSDGLLLIYPDFNNIETNPYLKEIDSDSRHMYQYSIENLSSDRKQSEWMMRSDMDKLAHKLSDLSLKSSALFETPPRLCTHVCLCMEIETGEHFEYDNVHVKFGLIVPDRCTVIDGETEGSTHSSLRKRDADGRWLIGFCHELNILCKPDYKFNEHLRVAYEVVSIDWWGRERSEGYAMTTIPFQPGIVNERVSCYRDVGDDTWIEWLERYFIGGRRKVLLNEFYANSTKKVFQQNVDTFINTDLMSSTFITFSGTQKKLITFLDHKYLNWQVSRLNRYGNTTKTTGVLNIKWNIIVQRDYAPGEKRLNIGKYKQCNRRHATIKNVLAGYREARERLEDIVNPRSEALIAKEMQRTKDNKDTN